MRALILSLLLVCGVAHAQDPLPTEPRCWPTVKCIDLDGPHVRTGREGMHLIWSGVGYSNGPRETWAMSCRWEKCSEAAWTEFTRALTKASTSSMPARLQIAKNAWKANVTLNCDYMAATPLANVIDERVPDWLLCREQQAFIGLIYPK